MGMSCDGVRNTSTTVIPRGGWHLSYFGTPEFISNKIQNFSHQEFNDPEYTNTDKIIYRIENGIDLFDRNKLNKISLYENDYLPYRWYIFTKPENPLKECYFNRCGVKSDINEHLPTLYRYALECGSIFETGVRGVISSYAFAYALQQNNKVIKELFVNDIQSCEISEISELCELNGILFSALWCNNLTIKEIPSVDLTFIDTWHVYGQLKRELSLFKDATKKYIILHDTTVDEIYGESIRLGHDIIGKSKETGIPFEEICKGIWPAVTDFLKENPEWVLKERFTNNNGLTVLQRN